jgi:hypothetical protein
MLHRRIGARFPPEVTLCIQAKEFNLGFIRPKNVVSHGLIVFRCPLANSKWTVMCLLLATLTAWLVECCRDGFPSGRFSHLHRGTLTEILSECAVYVLKVQCSCFILNIKYNL